MPTSYLTRACCFLALVSCWSTPAWAFKRDVRIPLLGCRGHFNASGSARSLTVRNEPSTLKLDELTIEVRNVPLKPGTVLVVYVDDETVGNIVLNSRQSGTLKITSETRKFVPTINWGTSVLVKKVDGSIVIW